MPVFLVPLLAGSAGFVAGSWTSGLVGKLIKLGLLAAGVYLVYQFGVK